MNFPYMNFGLSIELNYFRARFNVWLNNQNVSNRASLGTLPTRTLIRRHALGPVGRRPALAKYINRWRSHIVTLYCFVETWSVTQLADEWLLRKIRWTEVCCGANIERSNTWILIWAPCSLLLDENKLKKGWIEVANFQRVIFLPHTKYERSKNIISLTVIPQFLRKSWYKTQQDNSCT